MGSTSNSKKEKRKKSEELTKMIKEKQSQKRRAKQIIAKLKQEAEQEKQLRIQSKIETRIKSKEEERKQFLELLSNGKTIAHDRRVEAEIADLKRQEAYTKHIKLQPKLEEENYQSR